MRMYLYVCAMHGQLHVYAITAVFCWGPSPTLHIFLFFVHCCLFFCFSSFPCLCCFVCFAFCLLLCLLLPFFQFAFAFFVSSLLLFLRIGGEGGGSCRLHFWCSITQISAAWARVTSTRFLSWPIIRSRLPFLWRACVPNFRAEVLVLEVHWKVVWPGTHVELLIYSVLDWDMLPLSSHSLCSLLFCDDRHALSKRLLVHVCSRNIY